MPSPNINISIDYESFVRTISPEGVTSPWSSLGTTIGFSHVRQTNSVRTPGFRQLNKRQLPINPYQKQENIDADHKGKLVYAQFYPNGTVGTSEYDITNKASGLSATIPPWNGPDPYASLSSKLLSQLSTTVSQLAVSAAESQKTMEMITKSATRIYKAVKALKSFRLGDFTTALGISRSSKQQLIFNHRKKRVYDKVVRKNGDKVDKTYKDVDRYLYVKRDEPEVQDFLASTWLEYKYGWTPLLMDVYDQAKALAEHMTERSNAIRRQSASATFSENKQVMQEYPGTTWASKATVSETRMAKMAVSYSISEGQIRAKDTFGLNNPLLVAWELVPFSFVADWFLPLGTMIGNMTATNGLTFSSGFFTLKAVKKTSITSYGTGAKVYNPYGYAAATGQVTEELDDFSIVRHEILAFPDPVWPETKVPKSWQQAATSISLLHTLFLRK